MPRDIVLADQNPVVRLQSQNRTFPFTAVGEGVEIARIGIPLGDPLDAAPTAPVFLLFPEDGQDLIFKGITASPFCLRKGS